MFKYILKFSYNGRYFQGYGTQPHKNTVQDTIEEALSKINSNQEVKTFATSRTDTKVHALVQYLQVELKNKISVAELQHKLNSMLPSGINILEIKEDFLNQLNVRYDVLNKTYVYYLSLAKNPFLNDYTMQLNQKIDVLQLHNLSQIFVGEHDFTAFSNPNTDVQNKIRKINYIKVQEVNIMSYQLIQIEINGTGFLYNMIRYIVGTLLNLANNNLKTYQVEAMFKTKQKNQFITLAQPMGLYLKEINFKDNKYEKL